MPPAKPIHSLLQQIALRKLARFQSRKGRFPLVACVIIAGLCHGNAGAQLALTPATAKAGWTLTTFASAFPVTNSNAGPIGIAFTDAGEVLVTDDDGSVRVFPTDTDGQLATNVRVTQNYGQQNVSALTRVGAKYYLTQQASGHVAQVNADGTYNQNVVDMSLPTGLAVNPQNGHLFVTRGGFDASNSPVILDVDPVNKTVTTFLQGPASGDGLATDGNILYATMKTDDSGGHIMGYRISDKSIAFDSGYLLGADGCALGAGSLAGKLFVNTNYGQVFQIDLASQLITLIATGGSRGDYVTPDPDGSLLITQTDRIIRLTPPKGASFEVANVHITPNPVAGGLTATGYVNLTTPAPTDLVVSLESTFSDANVPATTIVAAGSITAVFTVSTTSVSVTTSGNIASTINGISKSCKMIVRPIGVKSLVLKPNYIKGGSSVTGTVTLESAAGPGSITVVFSSSDTAVVPTPASITIPVGQKSATFKVSTKPVAAETTVTLTGTANNVSSGARVVVTP